MTITLTREHLTALDPCDLDVRLQLFGIGPAGPGRRGNGRRPALGPREAGPETGMRPVRSGMRPSGGASEH